MNKEFVGTTLLDKYEIKEMLRESDLESVYRGTDISSETPITIKILSPTLAIDKSIVERFSLEARVISRLSHPNLLNITDFDEDEDGNVFIIMEDIEGETLKSVIKREGALSPERAVRIAKQVATALSTIHDNGIIHKGLTSKNVLISQMADETDLAKVLDVGDFKREEDEEKDFEDTRILEDLAYLSPEQCAEETEVDERSDIYSLGIIFYEMLTGEVPFESDDAMALMFKHSQNAPPPFTAFRDDIPDELEMVTICALAKKPEARYQTADDFIEELDVALKEGGQGNSIVIPKVDAAVASAGAKNNWWKTAFILLAGISLVSFGLIYWTNVKKTEPMTTSLFKEEGKPVQPLNPATGLSEQNIPNINNYDISSLDPNDPLINPTNNIGGNTGGYDPWSNPGTPPKGSPTQPIGPGGDYVTIDGNSTSPFNQEEQLYDKDGNRIILVPVEQVEKDTKKTDKGKPKPEKSPDAKDPKTDKSKETGKESKNTDKGKVDKNAPKKPEGQTKPKTKPKNSDSSKPKKAKETKPKKTLPKQPIAKNNNVANER